MPIHTSSALLCTLRYDLEHEHTARLPITPQGPCRLWLMLSVEHQIQGSALPLRGHRITTGVTYEDPSTLQVLEERYSSRPMAWLARKTRARYSPYAIDVDEDDTALTLDVHVGSSHSHLCATHPCYVRPEETQGAFARIITRKYGALTFAQQTPPMPEWSVQSHRAQDLLGALHPEWFDSSQQPDQVRIYARAHMTLTKD